MTRADIRAWWESGGALGVLGVVVPGIGLLILPIWEFPGTDATGEQISGFASANRGALQWVMVLNTVGVTLWQAFGAVVWRRLRRDASPASWLPACFAGGLIGFTTLLLAGFTAFDLVVYRRTDPAQARLLYELTFGLLAMSGMPTAASLGAYAALVYRHRGLPRFTADLAVITAAAHVLVLLSFVAESGFFSLEGAVITVIPALLWAWILATGMVLPRVPANQRQA